MMDDIQFISGNKATQEEFSCSTVYMKTKNKSS